MREEMRRALRELGVHEPFMHALEKVMEHPGEYVPLGLLLEYSREFYKLPEEAQYRVRDLLARTLPG